MKKLKDCLMLLKLRICRDASEKVDELNSLLLKSILKKRQPESRRENLKEISPLRMVCVKLSSNSNADMLH